MQLQQHGNVASCIQFKHFFFAGDGVEGQTLGKKTQLNGTSFLFKLSDGRSSKSHSGRLRENRGPLSFFTDWLLQERGKAQTH